MKKLLILTIAILFFSNSYYSLLAQSYSSSVISGISEIAGTGTSVTLTASVASSTSSGALPIGFTFNFYGNAYTDFYINPNGTLSFSSANQTYLEAYYAPQNTIPSANLPNNFIGFAFINPYDNYPSPNVYPDYSTATINYFVSGSAPNRILVINYKDVKIPATYAFPNQLLKVQIQLYESDGKIEVHNTNSAATQDNGGINRVKYLQIGIENSDGTNGTAATCPQNWNLDNKTVRFTYCGNPVPTGITPSTGICNAVSQQTVNLSATCSLGTATWYKDDGTCVATAGTLLTSTSVLPTVTTTYKVRCEGGICNSGFLATKITVTSSAPSVPSTITKNPTTPVNSGTSVTLGTNCSSGYYKWEDNSTYPTRVVTPSQSTTYSVKCLNGACESASVSTTVNVIVPPPSISTPTTVGCSGTSATLTATNCASPDIVTWYQIGVGNLGTGTTKIVNLTTSSALTINTYFASCTKNGIESNSSNVININVNGIPTAPTSITKNPTTPVNPNASVILTAVGCVSGNTVKWNDNSTTNPRTVNPVATTTFTAKCVNATCESTTATSVTVDVNGPPVITATVNPICGTGSSTNSSTVLTATGCTGTVTWSSVPTNASKPSGNSGTITNTLLTGNVTYTAYCTASGLTSTGFLLTYIPNENGVVTANPTQITSVGQSVALSTTNTMGTFTWFARPYSNNSQNQIGTATSSITYTPTSTNDYSVRTIVSGCTFNSPFVKVPFQLTVSGTGNTNLDMAFDEGNAIYLVYDQINYIRTLLSPNQTVDVGTSYFNQGLTTFGCGQYGAATCARAYFIMRKSNVWEIWDTQSGYPNTNVSQRLFHTKFKYDSNRPPCSAVWIKDADGSEVTLSNTGLCENVDNTVTSITLPATICAGQSMPVSFITSTSAASYTVEILWDYTYQTACGGPSGEGTTLINSVTTTTNNTSIPVQWSYTLNPSGCTTNGIGCTAQSRCDNYRIRITPIGSTQGVSQSLLQLNALPTATSLLTSTQTGNWNTPSTWQCGGIPTATNPVQVLTGHIIEINTDVHAKTVKLLGTGKLNYTGMAGKLFLNQ